MSDRVYLMKRVKDCKDVSIISPQDVQWRQGQVYSVCILQFSCFTKFNCMQSKHKKQNVNIADETLTDYTAFLVGITILNQRIIWKDDIKFVTEFPCLLGHPVWSCHIDPDCFKKVAYFFYDWATLKCCKALVFDFTSLKFFCTLRLVHFIT